MKTLRKKSRTFILWGALGGVFLIHSCTLPDMENRADFETMALEKVPEGFETPAAGLAWNFIPVSAKACCYQNGNGPDKAIDNNTGTYWHSASSASSSSDYGFNTASGWPNNHSGPHFITLDLGEVKRNIRSFVHIGRNGNGGITNYEIWTGAETPPGIDPQVQADAGLDVRKVAEGTWKHNGSYEEVAFVPPLNVRYFQVRVLSSQGNYGGGVEFKICGTGDFSGSADTGALWEAYRAGVSQLKTLKTTSVLYHKLFVLLYGEWDDDGLVSEGAKQILEQGALSTEDGYSFYEVLARQELLDKFALDIRTMLRAISPAQYIE
jgi:hypothetical protein